MLQQVATDILYYKHPLNLGNLGRSGNRSAVYSVQECDLLLNFGSRLTTKVVTNEKTFARAKVISFDIDNAELNQGLIKFHKGFQVDLNFIQIFINIISKKYKYNYKNEWRARILI